MTDRQKDAGFDVLLREELQTFLEEVLDAMHQEHCGAAAAPERGWRRRLLGPLAPAPSITGNRSSYKRIAEAVTVDIGGDALFDRRIRPGHNCVCAFQADVPPEIECFANFSPSSSQRSPVTTLSRAPVSFGPRRPCFAAALPDAKPVCTRRLLRCS